jgi:hypothetical protein
VTGLAELRQAPPQAISVEFRMYPDVQQTCDAFRPEFGGGVGEATKRPTYPVSDRFPCGSHDHLARLPLE